MSGIESRLAGTREAEASTRMPRSPESKEAGLRPPLSLTVSVDSSATPVGELAENDVLDGVLTVFDGGAGLRRDPPLGGEKRR